ncbi:hypothetical protein HanRHA438_Chr17g0817211 [Helianthus annuus]|nr:hypothetical protein HanIR_Chr17g0876171 [Helianthus annuus]KAJ0826699.1 hypothetical protein HanRHA438_Chr17g0817211 [Helianthus annuus]
MALTWRVMVVIRVMTTPYSLRVSTPIPVFLSLALLTQHKNTYYLSSLLSPTSYSHNLIPFIFLHVHHHSLFSTSHPLSSTSLSLFLKTSKNLSIVMLQ